MESITTMEQRINQKIKTFAREFKDGIWERVSQSIEDPDKKREILEFIYEYPLLCLDTNDFVKRRRIKNTIPITNRCNAKRSNGEQCTRRRKEDCEFCGTHFKSTPYGLINSGDNTSQILHKHEVFAEEIKGIVYYIDRNNNVYKTEDILQEKENPKIIAKYILTGNVYTIPEFGLV
jgi:hypothetical protein